MFFEHVTFYSNDRRIEMRVVKSLKKKIKRFIIQIIAFFHLESSVQKATQEQVDLFNNIAIGDLVFCDMPISKMELEKIKSGHTSRPYLIVSKKEDCLLGYPCSSKPGNRMTSMNRHKLSYAKYDFRKKVENHTEPTDTYVDLRKVWILNPCHLRFFMAKIDDVDLGKIERIISAHDDKDLVKFNIKIEAEIGDVYQHDESLFYVYQEYKNDLYCFPLKEVDYINATTVMIKNKKYLIDIHKKVSLKLDESKLEFICPINTVENVNRRLKKERNTTINEKNRKRNEAKNVIKCEHQIGKVYQCNKTGKSFIYLYTKGNNHFGADYELLKNLELIMINQMYVSKRANPIKEAEDELVAIAIEDCISTSEKLADYFEKIYQ